MTSDRPTIASFELSRRSGRIAGLLLAAGESRRMGRHKALLPVGNELFVQRVRRVLLDAALHPVLVVLGYQALDISQAAGLPPEAVVLNPNYEQGMLSSLIAGIEVLKPTDADALVLALVDGPDISPLVVRRLMERFWATHAPIIEPVHQGQHGHPVLIARELWDEIVAADPEQGAKEVIRRHRPHGAQVQWDEPSVLTDLDTAADYDAWAARPAMSALTRRILQAIDGGETIAVVSLVEAGFVAGEDLGSRLIVPDVGDLVGGFGDAALDEAAVAAAREVIESGKGGQRTIVDALGRTARAYVELIEAPPWLIVVGAGHVAKPTAALGKSIGFRVTVLDDRPDFANWERFPDADEVLAGDFRLMLEGMLPAMHRQTYVVLVTRGHQQDELALRQIIHSHAGYIGMIGSRRRSKLVLEAMIADGYPADRVAKVHSPIGLDIRAETPEEIAVSIIAEIISVRRGGTARTLSSRPVIRRAVESPDGP